MDPSSPEPVGPASDERPAAAPLPSAEPRPTLAARAIAVALLAAVLCVSILHGAGPDGDPAATLAAPSHGDVDAGSATVVAAMPPSAAGFVWPTYERTTATSPPSDADGCATGAEPAEAQDEEAFARRFAAAGRRARERLLQMLERSTDDRLRVLGLVLERDAEVAAVAVPVATSGEGCGRDAACAGRAAAALVERSRLASAPKTDAIARLASASRDPLAYGVEACAGNMAAVAPACRLVSTEQWARLDPDNAVPWLHVAATAAARRDTAALADAFHRVAQARSNRNDGDSVHELLEASLPADLDLAERVQVLTFATAAIASSSALPDYAPALDFCTRAAVRDSNRAQTCDALVVQLTDRASTLLDLAVGVRLAEQVDWPEDRIEDLRRRHDAYSRVQVEADAEAEPTSCRDLPRAAEQGARRARLGEIGALREAVALSGKSIAQLASEERSTRPVRIAEQSPPGAASN